MKYYFIVFAIVVAVGTPGHVTYAYKDWDQYQQAQHAKPAWFLATDEGGFVGVTEDGLHFNQTPVSTGHAFRLEKFSIGTVSFYVSDKGIINATDDLSAISIYLTLA